jgi:hypothetical protein
LVAVVLAVDIWDGTSMALVEELVVVVVEVFTIADPTAVIENLVKVAANH